MTALSKEDLLRAAIACDQLGAVDLAARLRAAAEGCVCVPKVPIDAMEFAFNNPPHHSRITFYVRYRAMLAAAPGAADD